MKRCIKCLEEKPLSAFSKRKTSKDGFYNTCKSCAFATHKEYMKVYRKSEKFKKYHREYYRKNMSMYAEAQKRYKTSPKWKAFLKKKLSEDMQFKLAHNLRSRLSMAVLRGYKAGSAVRDLGCSMEDFMKYMEEKFLPGMTWENHGDWHIDHIKPLSSFDLSKREHVLEACHFTNLQPLWAIDNVSKGARLDSQMASVTI